MLTGRMMPYPLTITHLCSARGSTSLTREVVTRPPDKSLHRQTYADFASRVARLANALKRLGVGPGDRVATLCWNHRQHLEAYYAVPMMGAVVHTLNLRLHPSELHYIAESAADAVLIVDRSLWKLYEAFGPRVSSVKEVIVVPDAGPAPEGTRDYEALLAAESERYDWPSLDEDAAAMLCYTSGTTGNPKGVLYSHRSTVLHALVSCMADTLSLRQSDTVLPVVPMFHAAAWGLAVQRRARGGEGGDAGPAPTRRRSST
ncbi:MAG: AMP-binding protein [Polyangiales bacterium]